MKPRIAAAEEYRGSRIVAVKIDDNLHLVCHFGLDQPDDFCIALEGENVWKRVAEAADKLSRRMNESYTLTLSAIIHALQGIITGEEEEVEGITDPRPGHRGAANLAPRVHSSGRVSLPETASYATNTLKTSMLSKTPLPKP